MSDAQHTPGPWAFGYEDHSGPEYIVGVGKTVATLRWGCSCCKNTPETFLDMTPEERANARLIAAAPDLLEALKATYARLPNELAADMGWVEAIITRATHPTTQQKR